MTASVRAQIIERRTYLRPLDDSGTLFETSEEAIQRQLRHQRWLWERAQRRVLSREQEAELEELGDLFRHREAALAGRTRWLGGTPTAQRREASQFNCAFKEVRIVHDVVDVFWLLLQGCGVGFRPMPGALNGFMQPIEDIEVVRSKRVDKGGYETNREYFNPATGEWRITVGDSAEAWGKAIGKIVAGKYRANKLVLDLSQIRPAGSRLAGYGWLCSGDEMLARAFPTIAEIMNKRAGQLLNRLDIMDIINLLGTVLSSRRSAQICLVPFLEDEWEDFSLAKKDHFTAGRPWRSQSNNSVLFFERPTVVELEDMFDLILEGGGSEPGLYNAMTAIKRAPYFRGTNPCLAGGTLIPTAEGLRRVETLTEAVIRDGNGERVPVRFRMTNPSAQVVEVETSDGAVYTVTPNHDFVLADGYKIRAANLSPGDELKLADPAGMFGTHHDPEQAYLDAWLIADGTWANDRKGSKLYLYGAKQQYARELEVVGGVSFSASDNQDRMVAVYSKRLPINKTHIPDYVLAGDQDTALAFIRGYTESDGHVGHTEKGWMVQYASVYRPFLQELQALLRLFGVYSTISLMKGAGKKMMPDGRGGSKEYECRDCFRLTVSNPLQLFTFLYPERVKRGPYKVKRSIFVVDVRSVAGEVPVYCCSVPTTASFDLATIHSGNCGEILLGDMSFCNLVEYDVGKFNGRMADLVRCVYLLARANYRQTCVDLRDGVLQEGWHQLNEFLRLCGVGPTGVTKWEFADVPEAWQRLRLTAREGADSMADELGLPRAKLVTTVKPSGTSSKTMGDSHHGETPEGVHKPLGRYIFNNVGFHKVDPMIDALRAAGYYIFDNPYDPTGVLVRLPVQYHGIAFDKVTRTLGDGREVEVEVNLESALDQLRRYKLLMDHYVDHNCSITVSYSPEEVPAIVKWIHEYWDSYCGVSFLLRNDPSKRAEDLGYPYLPQEVVDAATWWDYVLTLQPVNLDGTDADVTINPGDECSTGACPVR